MNKKIKALTIPELLITLSITIIAIVVGIATIVATLQVYKVNRERFAESLSQRVVNAHIHKFINEASYMKVRNVEGLEVETGHKLELYGYNNTAIGMYYIDDLEDKDLKFTDLRDMNNIQTKTFENVRIEFTGMAKTTGKTTEVRVTFEKPFQSFAFISCGVNVAEKADSWALVIGGAGDENAYSLARTSDGYVIAGHTSSFGMGDDDAYLLKVSPKGNLLWSKTFGTARKDRAFSVSATSGTVLSGVVYDERGFIIAGEMDADPGSSKDFFDTLTRVHLNAHAMVIKTDINGNIDGTDNVTRFIKRFVKPGISSATGCVRQTFTSDGGDTTGYVVSTALTNFGFDLILMDHFGDVTGDQLYAATGEIGLFNPGYSSANAVRQTFDGAGNPTGYIMAGKVRPLAGCEPYWEPMGYVLRLSDLDKPDWLFLHGFWNGNPNHTDSYDIVQMFQDGNNNGYMIQGNYLGFSAGFLGFAPVYSGFILKLNDSGGFEWSKVLGASTGLSSAFGYISNPVAFSLLRLSDNRFILGGAYSFDAVKPSNQCVLSIADANGNKVSQTAYGTAEMDRGFFAHRTLNEIGMPDGYIMVGSTKYTDPAAPGIAGNSIYIIKTDINGNCPEAENPTFIVDNPVTVDITGVPAISIPRNEVPIVMEEEIANKYIHIEGVIAYSWE